MTDKLASPPTSGHHVVHVSDTEPAGDGPVARTRDPGSRRQPLALAAFEVGVCVPVIGLIVVLLALRGGLDDKLIFWGALIAAVDMLPVAAWRDVQMLMDFPLIIALALRFDPSAAALTV